MIRAQFDAMIEDTRQLFEAKSAAPRRRDRPVPHGHRALRERDPRRAPPRVGHRARAAWTPRARPPRLMRRAVVDYPDLYHSGYTQDALKEVAEAFATYALVRGESLPLPATLGIEPATYLNGLAEAASELRRQILDIIRQGHSDEAVRLLEEMDQIYDTLISFDFHDAITGGLRRRIDQLRGVLERTRGDVTNSLRQQRLQDALAQFEGRVGPPVDDRSAYLDEGADDESDS
jgi:translin